MKPIKKTDLIKIFNRIDQFLIKKDAQPIKVIILGAASLIMLDIRERSTEDIDIANAFDASQFQNMTSQLGYSTDIVSITSTVDFILNDKPVVFEGTKLTVFSVTPEDLVKLKLERFRKQDPQDIEAIIEKLKISFDTYKKIVLEAIKDYVGNSKIFAMGILSMAEQFYLKDQVKELENELSKF